MKNTLFKKESPRTITKTERLQIISCSVMVLTLAILTSVLEVTLHNIYL